VFPLNLYNLNCKSQTFITFTTQFSTLRLENWELKYNISSLKSMIRLLSFHVIHYAKKEYDYKLYLAPFRQYSIQTSDVWGNEAHGIPPQHVRTLRDDATSQASPPVNQCKQLIFRIHIYTCLKITHILIGSNCVICSPILITFGIYNSETFCCWLHLHWQMLANSTRKDKVM